jgi:hypothetical protein
MTDDRKLTRSEIVALVGAVLLIIGVFLPWYGLENELVSINDTRGEPGGEKTLTGFEAHTIVRWLLLAAAAAPLILSYIILRGHALSWPRGEMTAVVSVAAMGLIGYLALVDRPGTVTSLVTLEIGVFVSLLGSILMLGGSALRASQVERPRKPPGVL